MPTRNSGRAWAWGIIVACAVFICMMLAFVFFAFSQQVDLVSRDYYQQEIEHQRQIDRVERTGDLPEDVAWDLRQVDDQLVCEFPLDRIEGEVAGTLHFYRPSDARLDRKWKIDLDEQGRQSLQLGEFDVGLWRVKIAWNLGDEEYYSEFTLMIE
ncbi:MAG: hypothetical protein HOC74_04550 [Gemmatimonadetes bacterium]|nr:hypothetical protein [Gemmatimonadota bacterium]